jgi:hypothetical protein
MFSLAVVIGIYSYCIFLLGVLGLIFKPVLIFFTTTFIFICIFYFRHNISNFIKKLVESENLFVFTKNNKFQSLLILILGAQILVNLVGVLGPETSFDALWYHLTLPKLYILGHSIFHIPGNLLFYSDMPKLTEMLYIPTLMFSNELGVKLIHFTFGILTLIAIYKISSKYLSKNLSLLATLIFYSNLVVGWESITAYIDLARTFFEVLALWGFLKWTDNKQRKWLIISGIMMGLAISSKVIALESVFIFISLFVYLFLVNKEKIQYLIKNVSIFCFFSLLIPLPWFTFAFINTGNPFYPFFSKSIDIGTNFNLPNVSNIISDLLNLFIYANDPISPIYLASLPLLIILYRKAKQEFKIFYIYSLLGLLLWYLTPRIGGGRFILPYLPAFSVLVVYSISKLKHIKLKNFLLIVIILISLSSIGYRALANRKYIPVILGKETKSEYLSTHLNFSFGDFYDTDGYFNNHLKSTDTVLLYGFHNLYYVDFNFIDSSWVKKGNSFNYIAVQNGKLPERFNFWNQVYYNQTTKVKLYSLGGQEWVY